MQESEAKKDPITIGNHEHLQNLENLVVVICGDFTGGGGGGGGLVFEVGYGVLFYRVLFRPLELTMLVLSLPCWPLLWPDSGRSRWRRFENWGREDG